MKLLIVQSSPSCHVLKTKCSLQHPVLKHPQSAFFSQCERPSFTPIQNNTQRYGFVSFNIYIFVQDTEDKFWAEG